MLSHQSSDEESLKQAKSSNGLALCQEQTCTQQLYCLNLQRRQLFFIAGECAECAPGGGKITVPPSPPKAAAAPRAPAPASMLSSASASAPPDASACRMDCAQSYYLCRAGDQADECGGGWSQCVAACNTPNLAPAFSAAP